MPSSFVVTVPIIPTTEQGGKLLYNKYIEEPMTKKRKWLVYVCRFYRWKFVYGPNSSNSISSFSSISNYMVDFLILSLYFLTHGVTFIPEKFAWLCMPMCSLRLFDIEQNQWSYHCRLRICWVVIMGLSATNKSFQTTSKSSNGTKPSGIRIKLVDFHIYLSDSKVKAMVERLAGDLTVTDPPIGILSDCNQDSFHEPLCDSFSFNVAYHGKEESLKERVLDIAKQSQEHCSTVKETINVIPPQNMKSRETDQDEALHCANLEVWSNISKWGDNQEGAASAITSSCSPSGSETSSSLSTMGMSTLSCQSEASSFSFTGREKEKEKEKDHTSIWSPQICVRPKNVKSKVHVWPPSTISSPTSKKLSKVFMPSENQSNGVSRSLVSNAPERNVKFVAPNQEKVSEDAFKSTTEANRSHPSRLSLSHHACSKQGILHCACKDGLPYYTFSLNERGQALVAKACKLSFNREDFDWIYTFHSGQDNNKKSNKSKWIRKDKHTPDLDLVGWMRVSSSLHPQFNSIGSLEHTLETEFVLFSVGAKHHHTTDIPTVQDEIIQFTTSNQLDCKTSSSEMSVDIFSQSTPPTTPMSTWPTSPKREMMKKTRLDYRSRTPSCDVSTLTSFKSRSADGNTTTLENRGITDNMSEVEFCALQPYSPHLESSAIVIRTPFFQSKSTVKVATAEDSSVSKDCGGWGLKFLEKSSWNSPSKDAFHCQQEHDSCTSQYGNISANGATDRCISDNRLCCGIQYGSSITAIIPADVHGLPTIKSNRPASLVERWKFDGKCDCGGWDLGCPIILLQNQRQSIINSNSNSMPQDCHSLHVLFKEGQQDTPALSMSAVNEGLYAISFESQLSDLQVFSICLALLHDRDRDIPVPPVRNKSRESYLRSSSKSPLRASRQVFSIPAGRHIGNQPSLRPSLSSIG